MTLLRSNATPVGIKAAATGAPSYFPTSAYQVIQAPSAVNGKSTLSSASQASWNPGGVGAISDDVIRHWSGGAKALSGTKLYVHGGGHTDCACNGTYAFDYSGTSAPAGWTLLDVSNTSAVAPGTYSDGRPASVHTYGGMCVVGTNVWRCGGSVYNSGSMVAELWQFSTTSNTWTKKANAPFGVGGALIGNASAGTSGKLLVIDRWGTSGNQGYSFYDIATNSWSGSSSVAGGDWPQDPEIGYKPATATTGTMLVVGANGSASCSVDWSANTVTGKTARSVPITGRGGMCFYDSTADRFWYLDSAVYNTIYEINPSTFASTSHALTGTTMSNTDTHGDYGHFGRYVMMTFGAARYLGVVFARNQNPYVIKLS